MATQLFLGGRYQLLDNAGDPVSGGLLYFYTVGTITLKDTYLDESLATKNTNPVVLDANGWATIFLNGDYKVIATNSSGSETYYTQDGGLGSDQRVDSLTELRTLSGVIGDTVVLTGSAVAGDGKGGTFWWDSTSTETDNGRTIIKVTAVTTGRWKMIITSSQTKTVTTTYSATAYDSGVIILADASGGAFTITLPDVTAIPDTNEYTIVKTDTSGNKVTITTTSAQLLDEGPTYTVTGAVDNGSGLVRLTNAEQRAITTGTRVVVAGVGGVAVANGTFNATVVSQTTTDLDGTTFSGTYTSGGTITYIRESVILQTPNTVYKTTSDSTRWRYIGGSLDSYPYQDILIGENTGYPGYDGSNNATAPVDFFWDAAKRRLHTRSVLLTEIGDPPEVGLRRAEGVYPNGPTLTQATAGLTLGLMHFTGWTDSSSFGSRSAQIYAVASENITSSAAGGELWFGTTPDGTASGALDRLGILNDGSIVIEDQNQLMWRDNADLNNLRVLDVDTSDNLNIGRDSGIGDVGLFGQTTMYDESTVLTTTVNGVSAVVYADQTSATGAKPVITLEQADVSEEFIRMIGTAANADVTQSIVAAGDVSVASIAGYVKIYVQDDGNQITDQFYYLPAYTLT